jgi:hypothetical protein
LNWVSPSATDIITLIWAALGGEKLGKSIDEVGDATNSSHLEDVRALVGAMFKRAELPEEQKKTDAA